MSCRQIRSQLPEYVRDQLASEPRQRVRAHLECCSRCQQAAAFESALAEELSARQDVPTPSAGFEARVMAAASGSGSGHRVHFAWGGAVAAALVVGLLIGQGLPESTPDEQTLAERNEPAALTGAPDLNPVDRTVRLAFTAGEPLEQVTLTLDLPPHVELSGLPGQHRVSWQVDLDQGDNVLALPLKILFPGAGELVAELDANGRRKVFRAVVPEHPGTEHRRSEEPAT